MHSSTKRWLNTIDTKRKAYLVQKAKDDAEWEEFKKTHSIKDDDSREDGPCYWNLFDKDDPDYKRFNAAGWFGFYFSRLSQMEHSAVVQQIESSIAAGAKVEMLEQKPDDSEDQEVYVKHFWKEMLFWTDSFDVINQCVKAVEAVPPRDHYLEFGTHAAIPKVISMLEGENYRITKDGVSFSNEDLAPLVRMFTG